jgi:membrane protein
MFSLFKGAASNWVDDNAFRLSAALAYYSIFSISPLLVISIAVAGWFLGHEAAQGLLSEQLKAFLGGNVAQGVEGMVKSASEPTSSVTAGVVGALTLLVGASGVFGELKDALNTIWRVRSKPGQAIQSLIRQRILSFGMVLVIGFLLLVSMLLTTGISALSKYWGFGGVATLFSSVFSFGIIVVLFAAIFKVLPDVTVRWRDVWVGAIVTAFLFELGKVLLGWYLGRESTASSYGAAASAVLILLWIYYASLILLFGAEFTQVFAKASGTVIQPRQNAERIPVVSESDRSPCAAGASLDPLVQPVKESIHDALGISLPDRRPLAPAQNHSFALLLAAMGGGILLELLLSRSTSKSTRRV